MLEACISDSHASLVGQQRTVVGGIFAQIQPLDGLSSGFVPFTYFIKILHPLARVSAAPFEPDVLLWSDTCHVHGVAKGLVSWQIEVLTLEGYHANLSG